MITALTEVDRYVRDADLDAAETEPLGWGKVFAAVTAAVRVTEQQTGALLEDVDLPGELGERLAVLHGGQATEPAFCRDDFHPLALSHSARKAAPSPP